MPHFFHHMGSRDGTKGPAWKQVPSPANPFCQSKVTFFIPFSCHPNYLTPHTHQLLKPTVFLLDSMHSALVWNRVSLGNPGCPQTYSFFLVSWMVGYTHASPCPTSEKNHYCQEGDQLSILWPPYTNCGTHLTPKFIFKNIFIIHTHSISHLVPITITIRIPSLLLRLTWPRFKITEQVTQDTEWRLQSSLSLSNTG